MRSPSKNYTFYIYSSTDTLCIFAVVLNTSRLPIFCPFLLSAPHKLQVSSNDTPWSESKLWNKADGLEVLLGHLAVGALSYFSKLYLAHGSEGHTRGQSMPLGTAICGAPSSITWPLRGPKHHHGLTCQNSGHQTRHF